MKTTNILSIRQWLAMALTAILALVLIGLPAAIVQAAGVQQKLQPTGALLLYSEGGKYNKVIIAPYGYGTNQPAASGQEKCGGKPFKDSRGQYKYLPFGLNKDKPIKLKCSAANYTVAFLKKGQTLPKTNNVADISKLALGLKAEVALQTSYCSFVHKPTAKNPTGITRNEAIDKNGRCKGDNDPPPPVEKETPVVSIKIDPNPIKKGKNATEIFEAKLASGEPLSPEECVGSFIIRGNTQRGKNIEDKAPSRYNSKTKSCLYRVKVEAKKVGDYKIIATFPGNKFLNPAVSDPYTYKIIK